MEGFDSHAPLRGGTKRLRLVRSIKWCHDLYGSIHTLLRGGNFGKLPQLI